MISVLSYMLYTSVAVMNAAYWAVMLVPDMQARGVQVGLILTGSLLFVFSYISSIGSLISDLGTHQEDFVQSLLKRNLSSWTESEVNVFMKMKESVYEQRRARIKKMCAEHQEDFSNGTSRMSLMFNMKDRVAYCAVPKAASSTWCWHFIQLGKKGVSKYLPYFGSTICFSKQKQKWVEALEATIANLCSQVMASSPSLPASVLLVPGDLPGDCEAPPCKAGLNILPEVCQACQAWDLGTKDQVYHPEVQSWP